MKKGKSRDLAIISLANERLSYASAYKMLGELTRKIEEAIAIQAPSPSDGAFIPELRKRLRKLNSSIQKKSVTAGELVGLSASLMLCRWCLTEEICQQFNDLADRVFPEWRNP